MFFGVHMVLDSEMVVLRLQVPTSNCQKACGRFLKKAALEDTRGSKGGLQRIQKVHIQGCSRHVLKNQSRMPTHVLSRCFSEA